MGEGLRDAIEVFSMYGVSAQDAQRIVMGILKEADEKVRFLMAEEMRERQSSQE